jgi:hypothetical protein
MELSGRMKRNLMELLYNHKAKIMNHKQWSKARIKRIIEEWRSKQI